MVAPPHRRLRYRMTPTPAGSRDVHTHAMSMTDLSRGTFSAGTGISPSTESASAAATDSRKEGERVLIHFLNASATEMCGSRWRVTVSRSSRWMAILCRIPKWWTSSNLGGLWTAWMQWSRWRLPAFGSSARLRTGIVAKEWASSCGACEPQWQTSVGASAGRLMGPRDFWRPESRTAA